LAVSSVDIFISVRSNSKGVIRVWPSVAATSEIVHFDVNPEEVDYVYSKGY
jgi:hypothetical protein